MSTATTSQTTMTTSERTLVPLVSRVSCVKFLMDQLKFLVGCTRLVCFILGINGLNINTTGTDTQFDTHHHKNLSLLLAHLFSFPLLLACSLYPSLSLSLAANYSYNLTLIVQGWWEANQYYDYYTAYCGYDDDDDNNGRRKKRMDDREEFDECQSYTQVGR